MSNIRSNEGRDGVENKYMITNKYQFYPSYNGGDDSEFSDDELQRRKKAQAELEREEAEVKRNIKSLMRKAPESLVLEDPLIADRVRNTRYEPQRYNADHEEDITFAEKKPSKKP